MSKITITDEAGRRVTFSVTSDVAEGVHQLLAAIPALDEYDYYGELSLADCRKQASWIYRKYNARAVR
jgi:hypothetical protein